MSDTVGELNSYTQAGANRPRMEASVFSDTHSPSPADASCVPVTTDTITITISLDEWAYLLELASFSVDRIPDGKAYDDLRNDRMDFMEKMCALTPAEGER